MNNFLKSNWAFFLILIFILITLFPPFNWYLGSSQRINKNFSKQLPLKNYDFIFNASIKKTEMENWVYNNYRRTSTKEVKEIPLQRSLILYELILNYVLSFLVIFLLYLSNEKRKVRKVSKASA